MNASAVIECNKEVIYRQCMNSYYSMLSW